MRIAAVACSSVPLIVVELFLAPRYKRLRGPNGPALGSLKVTCSGDTLGLGPQLVV